VQASCIPSFVDCAPDAAIGSVRRLEHIEPSDPEVHNRKAVRLRNRHITSLPMNDVQDNGIPKICIWLS
jgi:hypothetical protein